MEQEEKKEPVVVSVLLESTDDKPVHTFTPEINQENFNYHFSNLLNNFFNAFDHLLSYTSMLRPATKEERDLNVYVFETNDEKDKEHLLYKTRKFLHDETEKALKIMLSKSFPDIEYIDHCKEFQQTFSFEEPNSVIGSDYQENVKALTEEIRKDYSKFLENLYASLGDNDGDSELPKEEKEK